MLSHGQELYGQFILAHGDASSPSDWPRAQLRGWTLATHRLLPVVPISDSEGAHIGFLVGHALADGGVLSAAWRVRGSTTDPKQTEDELYRFGGRWVCILLNDQFARLYLDPSGSLATVYRTDRKLAGSTPSAVHFDAIDEYRARKSAEPGLKANQFYPAGLTGDDDTRRLLPNHYLDLNEWKPVRHWPEKPIVVEDPSKTAAMVKLIAVHTRGNIEALSKQFPLYMGLSAGRDSRMVLGCGRSVIDRMTFVTFNYKDPDKFADLHVAKKLASKLKLKHQTLDLNDPPRAQKDEYLFRVGYCNNAGKACDFYDACGSHLDMSSGWLTGYGGEVARAYYWKPNETSRVSAEELLSRMHLPSDERNLRAVREWLDDLPSWMDPYAVLDLAYLELRVGCWASPQQYGTAPFASCVMPFSHRDAYHAMFTLPIEYRRRQQLASDVLKLTWPEALALPFQQYTGFKRLFQRAGEKLRRTKRRLWKGAG